MLRRLFTREEKTTKPRRLEKRGYNPMPEGWKPPRVVPVVPTRQTGQAIPPQRTDTSSQTEPQPASTERPADPQKQSGLD